MKLVTFLHNGAEQVGVIGTDPAKVVPVSALGYDVADMTDFILQLKGQLPTFLLEKADAAEGVALSECRLLAPIKRPRQDVVCLGINYFEHREEALRYDIRYDGNLPKTIYFSKRVNEAVDPDGFVDGHTDMVERLDYEVELAVILLKDVKRAEADQVEEAILGYTILNDMSARDIQRAHQQWYFGKSLDEFTPMGPWIVTRDEFEWKPKIGVRSYVNGELRQNSNTELMMTGIDDAICQLTRGITLQAGTIIATGTPSGVGMGFDPPKFLKVGDVVRCEIDGIGHLENTIK